MAKKKTRRTTTTKRAEEAKKAAAAAAPRQKEFLDELPDKAPGTRPTSDSARDQVKVGFARIVALHSPCEVRVLKATIEAGYHATLDGKLLMVADVGGPSPAHIGTIPEGADADEYISEIVELAQQLLDNPRSRVRPIMEQLAPGGLDSTVGGDLGKRARAALGD